jgi:hypothetical protein
MQLEVSSMLNFTIRDGKITSQTNEPFFVESRGDKLVIIDDNYSEGQNVVQTGNSTFISNCGSGISINNNTVSMNGISIIIKGKTLNIKGKVNSIMLNGERIELDGVSKETELSLKENQYIEYKLEKESINSIAIKGSGGVKIEDNSVLSQHSLDFSINGSGDIESNNRGHFANNLQFFIMGSGDIKIDNFQSDSCFASIMGSGDIKIYDSLFNNINCKVMGSGDIAGRNTTAKNVSKNIMGSGDISGF